MEGEGLAFSIRIDGKSGVPLYRQIIEQVEFGVARGDLVAGDQLPTVRQLAVELSINPNTVLRAYREMEIKGVLDTQQGSGTFVSGQKAEIDEGERVRMLDQIVMELLARASRYGFSIEEVLSRLHERQEVS